MTSPAVEVVAAASAPAIDPLGALVAERLASGKLDLPLLPRVASQVVALVGDAKADANQLAALIHRDPALAGHVLRIANSAAYMPKMPIVSLQQAVARLGFSVITEIAFAASVQSGVFRVPGYEAVLDRLWRHALASGAFAKEVARARRANVESAFLGGLLHAVGKPALLQIAVDAARQLGIAPDQARMEALLEHHHAVVGMRIAEQWALPKQVVAAIQFYACHRDAGAFRQDAMITRLADRLATFVLDPAAFADEKQLRDDPVFGDLNLYPDDVTALLKKKEQVLQIVASLIA